MARCSGTDHTSSTGAKASSSFTKLQTNKRNSCMQTVVPRRVHADGRDIENILLAPPRPAPGLTAQASACRGQHAHSCLHLRPIQPCRRPQSFSNLSHPSNCVPLFSLLLEEEKGKQDTHIPRAARGIEAQRGRRGTSPRWPQRLHTLAGGTHRFSTQPLPPPCCLHL